MDKPLIVYKASAGSGKTFTLAIEYIKLLISKPQDFRSILAVTFTNKATEEMKTRILSQLYGIWRRLDDSQSYTDAVCAGLGVAPEFASRRAGIALQLLLHNYDAFRIETIDSFFQSVLRNLARELDLAASLRVELNDEQVERQAVDELIESLEPNDELLGWIMGYIKDNISEDKSWNVIGAIKSFGQNIFREFYKETQKPLSSVIGQSSFFDRYKGRMRKEKESAKERMRNYADRFFAILSAEGLAVDDLSNKSAGVAGFFIKLRNGIFDPKVVGQRVKDCLEKEDKWASKTHPERSRICQLARNRLIGLLNEAVADREKQWCRYKSAELTLRHLEQLRLLNSIEKKVRELNEECNRFLLSDTQYLLKSLISDSDSPFIYEKIGTQLSHVMIDEFQDTSTIQWRNFKVLLADCMSRIGSRNIIVGDVKQSIYRWRDGDWRLLNGIESQFPHPAAQMEIRNLGMNYRSQRNIVEFNNAFFTCAVGSECLSLGDDANDAVEQLASAYADVRQQVPTERLEDGLVSIELLPADDYQGRTLQSVAAKVASLLEQGVEQTEIAILVRTNSFIPLIANYFTENMPSVRIVSDEAFRLDASQAVNVIVNALHLLTHPDDQIAKMYLAKSYQALACGNAKVEGCAALGRGVDSLLPQEYVGKAEKLRMMPLYELAEQIYYIFGLKSLGDQGAYVCAFFDCLSEFTEEASSDIDAFVDKWNESLCGKAIQSSRLEGVRLISIHKSKGLEFDNVIMPFCDWQLEKTSGNVIWCSPDVPPYNELPLVPVDFNSGLKGSIYEKEYVNERFQNCVDNLNLLYVAFTRASKNLFVIGRRDASNSRSELLQVCLPQVAKALETAELNFPEGKENDISFCYGSLCVSRTKSRGQSANPFLASRSIEELELETFANKTEFKQSNKSHEFVDAPDEPDKNADYIKTGAILHRVFSTIATSDDVDKALGQLRADGVLPSYGPTPQHIINLLRKRLADDRVKDWFSSRWTLFNECTILSLDESGRVVERRPDRVMTDGKRMVVVDFKFGAPRAEHHFQVAEYMRLLVSMGHDDVKGYIWYVYNNIIEEVKEKA